VVQGSGGKHLVSAGRELSNLSPHRDHPNFSAVDYQKKKRSGFLFSQSHYASVVWLTCSSDVLLGYAHRGRDRAGVAGLIFGLDGNGVRVTIAVVAFAGRRQT
jgi:hypothetical protein